jgi:hypothetical protein
MTGVLDTVGQWLGFVAGLALVVTVFGSVINTVITPRSNSSQITHRTWLAVRWLFFTVADRMRRYEWKDRLLAYLAPTTLLAWLITWLLLFLLGYALMFWPLAGGDFGRALALSGSSLFTLGVVSAPGPGPIVLEFLTAATGLITVALQIGYLPTLYGTYNRRETLVTLLGARAGTPAWGPEILARHHLSYSADTLPALYATWENWAAEMAESHTSYPVLLQFRSPNRLNSWIIALLAVMDSAALYSALCPTTCPSQARQCIRMGFVALRAVGQAQGFPVNHDPRPDDPLQLTYEQFVAGVEVVRRSGFPLERSMEEAWPHFRGWRVNYEEVAYRLAVNLVAVPAPWSGSRPLMTLQERFDLFHNRPRHRTPDDPEGAVVLRESLLGTPSAGNSGDAADTPLAPVPHPLSGRQRP